MDFPQNMEPGFNFDEAIVMADLSRRAYRVFEYEKGRNIGELYDALYTDEWRFAHYISDYQTDDRALILKREKKNQYAVVFRGTIFTSPGIDFTSLDYDEETKLVRYEAISGEPTPPSSHVRVYQGMVHGFDAFRDELQLFFNVLADCKLEQKLLIDLVNSDEEERASRTAAIGAAIAVKYGCDAQKKAYELITSYLQKIVYGEIPRSDMVSFTTLIKEVEKKCKDIFHKKNHKKHDKTNEFEVYVTGHSRGAVLATFAALYLKRYSESKKGCFNDFEVKMYNIGSTKIGNSYFIQYYNSKMKGFSYRIQNLLDIGTYFPMLSNIRSIYNLALLLPGINYVENRDSYYAYYEHIGEVYTVFGLGFQKLNLNFGGPLNFTIMVPFPHGPDGYVEMLIEAKERQQKALMNYQNLFNKISQKERDAISSLDEKLSEIQVSINKLEHNPRHINFD